MVSTIAVDWLVALVDVDVEVAADVALLSDLATGGEGEDDVAVAVAVAGGGLALAPEVRRLLPGYQRSGVMCF